jgi:uncharacterized protein (DUF1330 family)
MAAYVIAEVDVHDSALFEEYRKLVPPTITKYGGKYVVRGGATESKEGGWTPKRVVVLEFPTMDRAREWYHSADYAPALAMRLKAAKSRMILAEGV